MIHKWELKEFKKGSKSEYRLRLKCQQDDIEELKRFLEENNILILKEFKSLNPEFNYVFYFNFDKETVQKFLLFLKSLCNDGEFVSQIETSEQEDGLKYLYELLKDIYEIPDLSEKNRKEEEEVVDKDLKEKYYEILKESTKTFSTIEDINLLIQSLFKTAMQMGYSKGLFLFKDEDVYSFLDGFGVDKNISGIYKIDIYTANKIKSIGKILIKDSLPLDIVNSQELFKVFPVGVVISVGEKDVADGFFILDEKENLKKDFKNDIEFLDTILHQIQFVLKSFRLKKEAIIDALTGVYRYDYFVNKLNEEIYRSSKMYKRPLSLIMLDIDDFKKVNDVFGHEIGNLLLKEIGKILKESVRLTDIVARYGGDEFAIIVIYPHEIYPNSENYKDVIKEHLRETLKIANTARDKIKNLEIRIQQDNEIFKLKSTVSIGISFMTGFEEKIHSEDLIKLADKALYMSKLEGKNKISIYGMKKIF